MSKLVRESVFVKKMNRDVFMNFITIQDDEWMLENWTQEELIEGLKSVNVNIVFAIFWRLMDDDAKRIVKNAVITQWDGLDEKILTFDDPVEKLKHIICGADELTGIIRAFVETRKKSSPDLKLNEKKKVPAGSPSVTHKSSTSSPASTDTQKTNTESLQGESSAS